MFNNVRVTRVVASGRLSVANRFTITISMLPVRADRRGYILRFFRTVV